MTAVEIMPSPHPFNVMLKPAGAACNLACTYCYYFDKTALHPETRFPRMSEMNLERYVINLIASQPAGSEVIFSGKAANRHCLASTFIDVPSTCSGSMRPGEKY